MGFETWMRKYETEYRGYTIRPGSVSKDDRGAIIFFCPLDASREEAFDLGKRVVDRLLDSAASDSSTTT